MALCPYCGCDLPGTEKLCRDCWEKQYADSSRRRWKPQDLLYIGLGVIVVVAILWFDWARVSSFEWARKLLALFSVTLLTAKVVLAAGIVATGLWDSVRARSWRIVLLWMVPVPVLAGFVFWKITGNAAWETTFYVGGTLVIVYRAGMRLREWRS